MAHFTIENTKGVDLYQNEVVEKWAPTNFNDLAPFQPTEILGTMGGKKLAVSIL